MDDNADKPTNYRLQAIGGHHTDYGAPYMFDQISNSRIATQMIAICMT